MSKLPPRYFRALNPLTLPQSLHASAGASTTRLAAGDVLAIDGAACFRESRFVNGRTRAGDLLEIDAAEFAKSAPDAAPAPAEPAKASKAKG